MDLLGKFPKRIKVGIKKGNEEVLEKQIRIKCDYIAKYCTTCKIQGHDEENSYVKHLELYKKQEKETKTQEPPQVEEGKQQKEAVAEENKQKEEGHADENK